MYERKAEEWKGSGKALFRTGNKSSKEYAESKRPLGNFYATPTEKVVNLLRSDFSLWKDALTDFEEKAIRKYSQNTVDSKGNELFRRINAMLRGEVKSDEVLERYSEEISSALRKGKLKRDVICYRGVDIPIYTEKKVGEIFVESQFMSTSVTQGGMLTKPYRIVIYAKKGTRAAYIEELSAYPKQRELLIDKNTVFRVISKQKDMIELEVI